MNMMDTVLNSPRYKKITKQIAFLGSGLFNVGNVQLGSAYNWFTGNSWEGFRTRFDVASNIHFDKKLWWHTYLAYGFGDKNLKAKRRFFICPKKNPDGNTGTLGIKMTWITDKPILVRSPMIIFLRWPFANPIFPLNILTWSRHSSNFLMNWERDFRC